MTYTLPLPQLSGTYSQRIAYPINQLVPGQVWAQTDSGQDGSKSFPAGTYFWPSPVTGWLYDPDSAGGGVDYDSRGRDTGAGGTVRVNNLNNQSTLIMANPTGSNAYVGLWERLVGGAGAVIGLFVNSTVYRTTIRTKLGQVLGLWSTDMTTGQNTRMLDLTYTNRHSASLRFGAGGLDSNFGQIPVHTSVDLSEVPNTGASETIVKTKTIPAFAFAGDGQGVEIFCWGVCAANTNAKRVRMAFGPSTIVGNTTSVVANGNRWEMKVIVYRTGPGAQKFFGRGEFIGILPNGTDGTTAEVDTADINVTVGLTGAQTGDITIKGFQAMFFN